MQFTIQRFLIVFSALLCGVFVHPVRAAQVTIIESQSLYSTNTMDIHWDSVLSSLGHTCTILPQTALNNTAFFATTDVLIVSSGSIYLPPNRVNTILQFLQTGKPVYLQGEYDCSLSSNQAFSTIVNALGGAFGWGTISNGIMPMNILGSFKTTPNAIMGNLPYFNFGCYGSGCGVQYFLENNARFYGFFFCPPNPAHGRIIQTTDQDWIINLSNDTLMKNIFAHLVDPALCNASVFTPTQLGPDTTLCEGSVYVLNASNSNATYLWQDGSTNPVFQVTQSGQYWVKVTNNCGVFSDTVNITFAPSPQVDLGNDTALCTGLFLPLTTGITGASVLWQDGSTAANFNAAAGGVYHVTVTLGNCTGSDTILIDSIALPVANLGMDTTLCEGEELVLDVYQPLATYLWQNGATSPMITVTQDGIYSVTVSNTCGSQSDSINVNFTNKPDASLGADKEVCGEAQVVLQAPAGNATYLWNNGALSPSIVVTNSGVYWVDVSNEACYARDSIVVTFFEKPVVDLGPDTWLCPGNSLVLNATTANASFQWQDGSSQPQLVVTQAGLYWVEVKVNNCAARDSIQIALYSQSCDCRMTVPNAFSPNGDQRNDEFKYIVNENNIELEEFIIADRWGNLMLRTQNMFNSWDGTYKGMPADIGTYYYTIRFRCRFTGESMQMKGDVLLLR